MENHQESIKNNLEEIKKEIMDAGVKIKKIEEEIEITMAKNHPFYFCGGCNGYLANSPESLLQNCKLCGQATEKNSPNFTKVLDARIISYLNGFWFEDYIAKIIRNLGWKTWCHGSVMGSSGISHPVDILAVDNKNGFVLVAECKSGNFKGRDIFNFAAQYSDIKCSYGLFFAMKENPDPKGKNFMERTPGLHLLDNIKEKTDKEILDSIKTHTIQGP